MYCALFRRFEASLLISAESFKSRRRYLRKNASLFRASLGARLWPGSPHSLAQISIAPATALEKREDESKRGQGRADRRWAHVDAQDRRSCRTRRQQVSKACAIHYGSRECKPDSKASLMALRPSLKATSTFPVLSCIATITRAFHIAASALPWRAKDRINADPLGFLTCCIIMNRRSSAFILMAHTLRIYWTIKPQP